MSEKAEKQEKSSTESPNLWKQIQEHLRTEGIELASGIWEQIHESLRSHGIDPDVGLKKDLRARLREQGVDLNIDIEKICCEDEGEGEMRKIKVVCVVPSLRDSVEEMGRSQRDQVVMVRVDEGTSKTLDAWVETGAVRSRSEAAALFIHEGLKVRAAELEQLNDAIKEVEEAKQKLKRKAREVFGNGEEQSA